MENVKEPMIKFEGLPQNDENQNGKFIGILVALNNVMKEMNHISKTEKSNIGFKYRGIDQVLNSLNPLFAKYGILCIPQKVLDIIREERETTKGNTITYTIIKYVYRFIYLDGTYIDAEVVGEAMDSGDKSCNKCMSVSYKYACFNTLCIPTEETHIDPDKEGFEVLPNKDSKIQNKDNKMPNKDKIDKIEYVTSENIDELKKICILNKIDLIKLLFECKLTEVDKMKKSTFEKLMKNVPELIKRYPKEKE